MRRSRGGLTTKIHIASDTLGRPVRFLLAADQRHDILAVPALLDGMCPSAVLADRAYVSDALRQHLAAIGAKAVNPCTRSRKAPIPHDPALYRLRNRIEHCFNKLKHFRHFATRYDRLASFFMAFIHPAATLIWVS